MSDPATDPLANTLRRAIASICAGMMNDDEYDASPSFLMAWPYLEALDFGVWQRFGKLREFVDHPALDDLLALSEAVTRYDADAVRARAAEAARWGDAVVDEGTADPSAEDRRQAYDLQVATAVDLGLPESIDGPLATRFVHRIGARLVGAVYDLVRDAGDTDLAHDIGEHIRRAPSMFGWWVEGTHIVLLATERRLDNPGARDLIAEIRALLMPLHFGLQAEEHFLALHIHSAAQRSLQVTSALRRWKEAPNAPLDFSMDEAVVDQWRADVRALLNTDDMAANRTAAIDAQTDAFAKGLVALEQGGASNRELLQALQDGVYGLARLDDSPESYGAVIRARDTMRRATAAVGGKLEVSPEVLFFAAAAGKAVETFGTPPD